MKRRTGAAALMTALLLACASQVTAQDFDDLDGEVVARSQGYDGEDFDLEATLALLQDDQIIDAAHLEELINDDNGINNVDTDGDGYVDRVLVREVREGDDVVLEFVAIPSSDPNGPRTEIGSLTFVEEAREPGRVEVVAAYPVHVHHPGYAWTTVVYVDDNDFCGWVYSPYRPLYTVALYPHRHHRVVYRRAALVHHRSHFRTTWRVRPVHRVHVSHTHRVGRRAVVRDHRHRATPTRRVARSHDAHRSDDRRSARRSDDRYEARGDHRSGEVRRKGDSASRGRGKVTTRRRGTTTRRKGTTTRRTRSRTRSR